MINELLTDNLIEQAEIQIYKRVEAGYTNNEILEEMRDSYAELFEDRGIAEGKEALMIGKKLTLKIMDKIKEKRNLK